MGSNSILGQLTYHIHVYTISRWHLYMYNTGAYCIPGVCVYVHVLSYCHLVGCALQAVLFKSGP